MATDVRADEAAIWKPHPFTGKIIWSHAMHLVLANELAQADAHHAKSGSTLRAP